MNAHVSMTAELNAWISGTSEQPQVLFDVIYDRLHDIAGAQYARKGGARLLQTTAIVNEAYLRLMNGKGTHFEDREHFFAYCSKVMRHVLLDLAKERARLKRGAGAVHVELEEARLGSRGVRLENVVAVHEALEALETVDPARARVVELRYFGGMTSPEIAGALGLSEATVHRRWRMARAWLFKRLQSIPVS